MNLQEIGRQVLDFSLDDLHGQRVSLTGRLGRSKGAVVVFWSGVCSHCQRYDAYLNRLASRHPGLALAAVASRQNEGLQDLARIAAERRLEFPILHDGDRRVAKQWLVAQTPRVFLVDRELRLVYRGAIDNFKYPRDPGYEPYLESAIVDFLAGRPPRRAETPSFGCPIESIYYEN